MYIYCNATCCMRFTLQNILLFAVKVHPVPVKLLLYLTEMPSTHFCPFIFSFYMCCEELLRVSPQTQPQNALYSFQDTLCFFPCTHYWCWWPYH